MHAATAPMRLGNAEVLSLRTSTDPLTRGDLVHSCDLVTLQSGLMDYIDFDSCATLCTCCLGTQQQLVMQVLCFLVCNAHACARDSGTPVRWRQMRSDHAGAGGKSARGTRTRVPLWAARGTACRRLCSYCSSEASSVHPCVGSVPTLQLAVVGGMLASASLCVLYR